MRIVKFILHRYKRVFLSDIETIEYTPEDSLQLILGSNGSGKSSLLSMLNPLPGNLTKDFREGGYKYIEIEHNHKYYKLHSGVDGTRVHSFIVDDIEYNTGGTISVQAELVKDHFKVDNNKMGVIIGTNRFCIMSPNERKKWITEISDVDYSYSIGVYNKLKTRHRDIVGGIKLLQNNILSLESEEIDVDKVKIDRDIVVELIEHMLKLISNVKGDSTYYEHIKQVENIVGRLKSNTNIDDITSYKVKIDVNNNKILEINNKLEVLTDRLSKLNNSIDGNIDKSLLINKINELTNVVNNYKFIYDDLDVNRVDMYLNDEYSKIVSLLSELDGLHGYSSDTEAFNNLRNEYDIDTMKLRAMNTELVFINKEITDLDKLKDTDNKIVCNSCGNSWISGYDVNKYNSLLTARTVLIAKIEIATVTNSELKLKLDKVIERVDIVKNIKSVATAYTPLWIKLLKDVNIHTDRSNVIINRLDSINIELVGWREHNKLVKELKLLNDTKHELDIRDKVITELGHSNKDTMLDELNVLTVSKNILLEQISSDTRSLKIATELELDRSRLKNILNSLYSNKENSINNTRDIVLIETIGRLKEIVVDLDSKIRIGLSNRDKLKTDTKLLEKYNITEGVLKLMVKELSPSEGLIAKSINSFLNVILREVNMLINSVWDYEMLILPCEVGDGNDLDYKFKVLVDNKEVIEDISKTSSSMQEIIDLAFRIVYIKYSGLEDFPLILDEFGRTFDATHRISAYNVVDKIMSGSFNQIFMVSHFESMYGRFNNADINILNTNGVDMSGINKYNTNMKLY